MGDKKDRDIKVAIRLRSLISREEEQGLKNLWTIDGGCQLSQKLDSNQRPWIFDRVFDQNCTTVQVYNELVNPIVSKVMLGFNGTVFAYGQTSSGKTYTMMGAAARGDLGILPSCVNDIYNCVESTPNREFLIRIAFFEIYNEVVTDLLHPEGQTLDIRENDGRIELCSIDRKQPGPCTEKVVRSPSEALSFIKEGEGKRHYGATAMNEKSSRSHTIFRIVVESRERDDESNAAVVLVSHLNLVDLAGSENAKQTGATGQRLVEGSHINRSLFTLGQVISQLSAGAAFISYRDCKLTRILQGALGGNSMTAFICCVTPAVVDETVSTLRFASSAKTVKNRPVINEASNDSEALMRKYRRQITELEQKLQENRLPDVENLQQQLAEQCRLGAEKDSKIEALSMMLSLSSKISLENSSEKSKPKSRRRETWGGGQIVQVRQLGEARLLNESTVSLDSYNVSSRKRRGPSAGVDKVSSHLWCLDEALEVESPTACRVDPDDDEIEYQRRSFEHMVSTWPKSSLDNDGIFTTTEAGVQTEPVTDVGLNENDELLADIQQQLSSVQHDAKSARDEAELARAELHLCRAEADAAKAEVTACRAAVEAADSEVKTAHAAVSDLSAKLDSAQSEITLLKSQLSTAAVSETSCHIGSDNDVVDMSPALLELQARLDAALAELENAQLQAVAVTTEVEELKVQLQAVCTSSQLTETAENACESEGVFERLRLECQELKVELEQSATQAAYAQSEITGLTRELDCSRGDFDRVKLEAEALKVENDNLKLQADLWKSGMESSKFEVESLTMELERSKLDSEFDRTIGADDSRSELLVTAKLAEERAHWDLEKKTLMHQVKEMFELSQSFAEESTLLREQLTESKKEVEIHIENARYLQKDLNDLREYTRYEKEYRDLSVLQHDENVHSTLEMASTITQLQLQVKQLTDECSLLRSELQAKDADFQLKQDYEHEHPSEIEEDLKTLKLACTAQDRPSGYSISDEQCSVSCQTDILNDGPFVISVACQTDILNDCTFSISVSCQTEMFNDCTHSATVSCQADLFEGCQSANSVSCQTDTFNDTSCVTSRSNEIDVCATSAAKYDDETVSSNQSLDNTKNKPLDDAFTTEIEDINSSPVKAKLPLLNKSSPTGILNENQQLQVEYTEKIKDLEQKLQEQTVLAIDAQDELMDVQDKLYLLQTALDEKAVLVDYLTKQISESEDKCCTMTCQLDNLKEELSAAQAQILQLMASESEVQSASSEKRSLDSAVSNARGRNNVMPNSCDENADELSTIEKEKGELMKMRQKHIADCNRDQYMQKLTTEHDQQLKEMKQRNCKLEAENKALSEQLSREVQELTKRLQKEICDHQLAEHRFAECEREKAHLKSELSSLEAIASRQDVVGGIRRQNELDPQRLQEHLKKMSLQLDLTNQRCLNYEAKNKSLEVEVKKNEDSSFRLSSLQAQLREIEYQLGQKRDDLLKVEKMNVELKAVRVALEEKLFNIARTSDEKLEYVNKNAKEQIAEIVTRNEEAVNDLISKLNCEKVRHEEELEQLTRKYEQDICSVKQIREEELGQLTSMYEQRIVNAKLIHEEELDQLTNKFEQETVTTKQIHEVELKQLTNKYEHESVTARKIHEDELRQLTSKHEQEIVNAKLIHEEELKQLMKVLACDQQAKSIDEIKLSNEPVEILQNELRCINEQLNGVRRELEKERNLREELRVTMEAQHCEVVAERDTCADSLAQLTNAYEKTIGLADAEMNRITDDHRREMEKLVAQHTCELRKVLVECEDQIKQVEDKHQKEMTLHTTDLATEFGRRTAEHETEIEKMAGEMISLQDELKHLSSAYQQLLSEFNDKIAAVREDNEVTLEEMRRRHAAELASLDDEDAEIILTQKECEIAELESKLDDLHCHTATQIENARHQCTEEIEAERNKLATKLGEMQSTTHQQIAALEARLQELTCSSSEQLENLRCQHIYEVESLRQQQSEELDVMRNKHASILSDMQQQIADREEKLKELTSSTVEQLDYMRRQHSDEIESLREQHSEEIEALKDDLVYNFNAKESIMQQEIADQQAQLRLLACSSVDQIETLRREYANEVQTLMNEIRQNQSETVDKITDLDFEQQLAESKVRVNNLESIIDAGKKMVEKLQTERQEQATTIANYEAELDDLEAERSNLVAELKVKEELIASQTHKLESLEHKCSDAKHQMEEMKMKIEKLTRERQELLSAVDQVTVEKEQLQFDIKNFALEKGQLEAVIAKLETEKASSDDNNESLSKRVAELEEIVKSSSESPQSVAQLQERIKELEIEVYVMSKRFRGMEAAYNATCIEKFKSKNETLAVQKQLKMILGTIGPSESGISFDDALKQHKQEVEHYRNECTKLRKHMDEADAERDDAFAQLLKSQEENRALRTEMEKLQAPVDVSELRRNLADSRLRINKLEHQLMKEKDPLEREIRGLKSELERCEELRRHLQNELRRSQSSADVVPAKSHGTVKSEPIDPNSCGIVGMILLSRTESELAVAKRKNEDLSKSVIELKQKMVEYKEKIEKQNREIVELRSHAEKRRLDREARPSPRRALSPRQDRLGSTPVAGFDNSTLTSSCKVVEDPNKCRQQ